ncbi:hypothetical protein PW52_07010 [Tamlana sedimentorum]|uniref:Uncharacterized protein n=1 Tax=Neotamlana sedimentorum TaxID=1435349 RepID=A0A0D7WB89_9FLAO|nr:hypothetical protein [Tamlana sedimentorum]KJD36329.1 hypothetical protein PW52_07010 [Tamlana sedimentorum]
MSDKSNFPYKTLIWALVALIALFLFKSQFENLLTNASELNIMGVVIKTNDKNAQRLKDSLNRYKTEVDKTITDLTDQLSENEADIKQLVLNNSDLKKQITSCTGDKVNQTPVFVGTDIMKMLKRNNELKAKTNEIKKVDILSYKK